MGGYGQGTATCFLSLGPRQEALANCEPVHASPHAGAIEPPRMASEQGPSQLLGPVTNLPRGLSGTPCHHWEDTLPANPQTPPAPLGSPGSAASIGPNQDPQLRNAPQTAQR